ncbi:hypothetical protein Trydic_g2733 [Trypoxylus dichotomus]
MDSTSRYAEQMSQLAAAVFCFAERLAVVDKALISMLADGGDEQLRPPLFDGDDYECDDVAMLEMDRGLLDVFH